MNRGIELADSELFKGVPPEAFAPVKGLCKTREYNLGEAIFEEDQPAEEVYILKSGKVDLSFTLPQQAQSTHIRITEIHPGEVFGWSALGGAKAWTASASAIHDSVVYCVPAAALKQLMDADPSLGYPVMERMLQLVAGRLRDTRHQLRWLLGSTP